MLIFRMGIMAFLLQAIHVEDLYSQWVSVTGQIRDQSGNPVIFASIKIRNTKKGTTSDTLGIFKIKVKPNDRIIISAIGFTDTTISVGGRANLTIVLLPKTNAMQQPGTLKTHYKLQDAYPNTVVWNGIRGPIKNDEDNVDKKSYHL